MFLFLLAYVFCICTFVHLVTTVKACTKFKLIHVFQSDQLMEMVTAKAFFVFEIKLDLLWISCRFLKYLNL